VFIKTLSNSDNNPLNKALSFRISTPPQNMLNFSMQTRQNLLLKLKTNRIAFLLIVMLLITNVITFVILFAPKEPDIQKFPLIDPLRNEISQEHFIVNFQPLRESLQKIATESDADVGIYFEFLNTGANISINQDTRFWPASLIKLPTALAVLKKIERGEWHYNNKLVLFEQDKDDRYGDLYKKPVGSQFTIEELLEELIIHSDDTAHRIFMRNLDGDNFIEILEGLGMETLYDQDYNITAKEYSRIFRALFTSSFLKREYSQKLLDMLARTPFTEFLAKPIPDQILFSHKIGEHDVEKTYLDAGIVYVPQRPYIITVMVKIKPDEDQRKAEEIMRKISEQCYNYVSTY